MTRLVIAQSILVPKSYSNLTINNSGDLTLKLLGKEYTQEYNNTPIVLDNLRGNPIGAEKGIQFDFGKAVEKGVLYYGFIPYDDMSYPLPVYFKRTAKISDGKAFIDITKMDGRYDMISWGEKGVGTLGYRVQDEKGKLLYDGIFTFEGKSPFSVVAGVVEGPSVAMTYENEVVLRLKTDAEAKVILRVDGREIISHGILHEIKITDLESNKTYDYEVIVGKQSQKYSFKTSPKKGSRAMFKFAYASDSRSGVGGGERNLGGTNFYMTKKILAYARMKNVSFMQFTGDLISGYNTNKGVHRLQYSNWKRAIEPWAHYFPVIPAIGNHEILSYKFRIHPKKWPLSIDRFPFETESTEAIFAQEFTLPTNGPDSEDGAYFEASENTKDFPTYKENVFYYVHDNIAMIVLNSHYWYSPSIVKYPETSGCPHGYMMENQIKWLKNTLQMLEKDDKIDHVFVTQHTPTFPNGGHTRDAMYYGGNNEIRAIVAGKPVKKGIIDVRDEYLDALINKSTKVRAILTGDEHNYSRTKIGPQTKIYPKNWTQKKLKLKRTIYQINNGAAGAPYYAQKEMPWTDKVSVFSTQNAVVIFTVNGGNIKMEVTNPDSFDEIDSLEF